uniref:WAP domain-containing protein n=1 Tax=Trichuris muris TaxID=70415 RepID=A0A5S6QIV0_TRIMR
MATMFIILLSITLNAFQVVHASPYGVGRRPFTKSDVVTTKPESVAPRPCLFTLALAAHGSSCSQDNDCTAPQICCSFSFGQRCGMPSSGR